MKKNTLATKVLEDMIVYKIIVTQPCEEKKKKTPIFISSGKSNNCFWHEKEMLLLFLFYLEISIVVRKDRSKNKQKKHPVTYFYARRSYSRWSCSRAWKNEMMKFLVGALIFFFFFMDLRKTPRAASM